MARITFSIIVPTFNRAERLGQLLNNLSRMNYPLRDFEVIIVDDGSTDKTKQVVSLFNNKFNLKYIHLSNSGPAIARNKGISLAKFRYIAFIDDDCLPDHNWLKIMRSEIVSQENLLGTYGRVIGSATNRFSSYVARCFLESMWYKFTMNNICFERNVATRTKFKPNMRSFEDVDFVLRAESLIKKLKGKFLPNNSKVYHRSLSNAKEVFIAAKRAGLWVILSSYISIARCLLIFVFPFFLAYSFINFNLLNFSLFIIYFSLFYYLFKKNKCKKLSDVFFIIFINYLWAAGFLYGLFYRLRLLK